MAKICVPVCVRRVDELRAATHQAARVGDVVELRLDYLEAPEAALAIVRELIDQGGIDLIVTMRASDNGGAASHTYDARCSFWMRAKELPGVLFDVELEFINRSPDLAIELNRVICSHHDFRGVPADLNQLYEAMAVSSAKVIKIAVQAADAVDCLPIFQLIDRARTEGRNLIAIAMGSAGILTRVLGPSRGSFLTYGSIDDQSGTAPGQLTARDLRELYRIDQIDSQTQVFGIMGKPVGHSLSPRIHNAAFAAAGINAVYLPMEVQDAIAFMRRMAHPNTREMNWNLRGLSVTAPHKATVMQGLDWIDDSAKDIGAVNTIVAEDGRLLGYNTDAEGFIAPIRSTLGDLNGVRCAVIGSGGAARAVLWALRKAGAEATLVARNRERANDLAQRFKAACPPQRPEKFGGFDVVINATPMGTRGPTVNETPATTAQLRGVRLAYDLVYNPSETRFLREARDAGCDTLGGIEMLLAQAVEQFKRWTASEPDRKVMRVAALNALVD
ncbi:MAG TPA: shikimate dehydrogenase [Pyrinomonadaceae bacterium]|nr:shikimate dehydrogenase [Pyrinomonadaceae bacterium]